MCMKVTKVLSFLQFASCKEENKAQKFDRSTDVSIFNILYIRDGFNTISDDFGMKNSQITHRLVSSLY